MFLLVMVSLYVGETTVQMGRIPRNGLFNGYFKIIKQNFSEKDPLEKRVLKFHLIHRLIYY